MRVIRRAVLARISAWLDGGGRFLLVTGGMGSGKTELTRQLVEALAAADRPGAAHYCDAGDASTIAVSALLESWGSGLARLPGYYAELSASAGHSFTGLASGPGAIGMQLGEVRLTIGDVAPAEAFLRAIVRPLRRLADAGRLPPVVLIVDAVDEARDADGRNRVLALLAGLTSGALPPGVRVVATARPDHDVRTALEDADVLDVDALGRQDVTEYVEGRADPGLAAEIVPHAQGNFLLAKGILDELEGGVVRVPALPRSLTGIFRKRLWRLVDEHDPQPLDVLGLLAVARAPLREREIAVLLGAERHRIRAAVNRILPVLAHDPERRYRLVHRALAEFLLDPEQNPLPMRDAAAQHGELAERLAGTWSGRWEHCDEAYAVHHVIAHLTSAVAGGAEPARTRLAELVGDPGFLRAKAALAGVDELRADLEFALPHLPELAGAVRGLDRALRRQAHHLRGWSPREYPALFTQQLRHDATVHGDAWLLSVLNERSDLARLELAWARADPPPPLTATLTGHRGAITASVLTPDGGRVITADDEGTARVWDSHAGTLIHVLPGAGAAVSCLAASPDGTRLVVGTRHGTAALWDLRSGQPERPLAGAEDRLTAAAFTAEGARVVAASWDRAVRVWSVHTGQLRHTMRGHLGRVETLTLTPDDHAVTTSGDGTTREWNLRSGRQVPLRGKDIVHPEAPLAITVSGSTATVSDLRVAAAPGEAAHSGRINAIAPGRFLVTASDDGTARVWDAETGERLGIRDTGDWVTAVAAGASLAVTGGWRGTVQVWDLPRGGLRHALTGHGDRVSAVALGQSLAVTGSWDTTVRVWEPCSGRLAHTLEGHRDWVTAVGMLPDGRPVSGSADGTARIWNVHSGQKEHVLRHRGPIGALAVTPDGLIVTAGRDGAARVWTAAGEEVRLLAGHEGPVNAVAAAETVVVTGSEDGTAVVWDPRHGGPEHTIDGHGEPVTAVATAGGRVATAAGNTVRVWDPGTTRLAGLPEAITCLTMPDPDTVAVGTAGGGLFTYHVAGHGRRTTATPNGTSASAPAES